ncbi:MAG: hypothetical protein OXG62_03980 [Nitrospinae bacterium]|nr:hypothetical protein [Nitrospinota bacterium]
MVIDKLNALEAALANLLEERNALRRSRAELESQLQRLREEARVDSESVRAQADDLAKCQAENAQLQKEQAEIRERVEKILAHIE